jgi:hypothetical protein
MPNTLARASTGKAVLRLASLVIRVVLGAVADAFAREPCCFRRKPISAGGVAAHPFLLPRSSGMLA